MAADARLRSSESNAGRSFSCSKPPRLHVRQYINMRSMCAAAAAGSVAAAGDSAADWRDPSSRVSRVLTWHTVSLCITGLRLILHTQSDILRTSCIPLFINSATLMHQLKYSRHNKISAHWEPLSMCNEISELNFVHGKHSHIKKRQVRVKSVLLASGSKKHIKTSILATLHMEFLGVQVSGPSMRMHHHMQKNSNQASEVTYSIPSLLR